MVSILTYGAVADGQTDCSQVIAKALEKEEKIYFPAGIYALSEAIRIPSHRYLKLEDGAVLFAADGCFDKAGCVSVITNADHDEGNEDIILEGGKIDANNLGNARADWVTGPNSGLTAYFKNVRNLTVREMTFHNSESYNFLLNKVEDFLIEKIRFTSTRLPKCQDGIHIHGHCHRGILRDIYADYGCTNDDLIALNADEVHGYAHNANSEDGPITDILIENVYAESCWSAVRLLSIWNPLRNITIRNLKAGVRKHGFNCDSSRYCSHPIFDTAEYPRGVGSLDNVLIEDVTLWRTDKTFRREVLDRQGECALKAESFRLDGSRQIYFNIFETSGSITIRNLKRDLQKDCSPEVPFTQLANLFDTDVTVNGEKFSMDGEQKFLDDSILNMEIMRRV